MRVRLASCCLAMTMAQVSFGQQMADTEAHSKYISAVDEYVPAPGQFVNTMPQYEDGDDAAAMLAKCTEALAKNKRGMVTLGGFGGYITFHFDHSIANVAGQNDFYISGNAIVGGAEPGIVMVSKDINHNGLPDDPWYELAGSADADSVGKVAYGYSITYSQNPLGDIPWTDNNGNSGHIARNSFHSQEYFPQWMSSPLTFSGTLLPPNARNTGTGNRENWVRSSLRYGYADNVPNADSTGCGFDIEWAVDENRKPVALDFIDFVRVYTAVNQCCGWTGETSTEITGAEDLHLDASLSAILSAPSQTATFEDVLLDENGYWNGSDMTGAQTDGGYGSVAYANSFVSGSYRFENIYNETWGSWSGFAVSNKTSVVFNDYDDQYNSAVGSGHDGSANYAVVFPYEGERVSVLNRPEGEVISGFYVTNTANNIKAYKEGDGMTGSFATGDWCKLTVTGHHADGTTADVDVYLADYRSADASRHYCLDYWQWVDLTALGKVRSLSFAVSSSHNNDYGMTTPGYFCMDDFNGVPDGTVGVTGVPGAASEPNVVVGRYGLNGEKLDRPRRGINIIRMSDGSVRKVIVK